MIGARMISGIIGYFMGCILSGYLVGKSKDVDIRKQGSGNVGTTNTMRILGIRAGVFTLICDCLKPMFAMGIVWLIYRDLYSDSLRLLQMYAACGAIVGHDFPVFMKFKGGKGIACGFGMIIALFPICLPVCVAAFLICVLTTRYVSLGSIVGCALFAAQLLIFANMGLLPFPADALAEVQILGTLAAALSVFLHRSNIVRLLHGEENKMTIGQKSE